MNFFERILTALGLRKKEQVRIAKVKNYDKARCERALAEAEGLMAHRDAVEVRFEADPAAEPAAASEEDVR